MHVTPYLCFVFSRKTHQPHNRMSEAADDSVRQRFDGTDFPVPTKWEEIRHIFRALKEPIILFGEDVEDRRTRLRQVLHARIADDYAVIKRAFEELDRRAYTGDDEEFVTRGPAQLASVRAAIIESSLTHAKDRLSGEHDRVVAQTPTVIADMASSWRGMAVTGFVEPMDGVRRQYLHGIDFTASGAIAVGSFQGDYSIATRSNDEWVVGPQWRRTAEAGTHGWAMDVGDSDRPVLTTEGRNIPIEARVTSIVGQGLPRGIEIMSTDVDGCLTLWSGDPTHTTPSAALTMHHPTPVDHAAPHPTLSLAVSAAGPKWYLWDVNVGTNLSAAEGHALPIKAVVPHPDGAMLATVGMDSTVALWDMRTGQRPLVLSGHVQGVVCAAWAKDGYRLATGGLDQRCLIWDVRRAVVASEVMAHGSTVTAVGWTGGDSALWTGGHDHRVVVRNGATYDMEAAVDVHTRVMAVACRGGSLAVAGRTAVSVIN